MKNLYALLLMAFMASSAAAQQYVPFPESGAVWRESRGENDAGEQSIRTWDYHIKMEGDTVIDGKTYHLLTRKEWYYYWPNQSTYSEGVFGAIREDDSSRVYFYPAGAGMEFLLYDFNLQQGDTLPQTYSHHYHYTVSSVDSVLIGSKYHKRFGIDDAQQSAGKPFAYLIEGIGSTLGLVTPLQRPFESYSTLHCFMLNGKSLFPDSTTSCVLVTSVKENQTESSNFNVFPNPSNGNFTIQTQSIFNESEICVRDVFGRIILLEKLQFPNQTINISNQPKGLYFVELYQNSLKSVQKIILQ